jgi:predicted GNAT family acetyltransferase
MKTIDIQKINTKRNPLMVYDDSLNDNETNYSCKEKVDKANQMLKANNFFEKIGKKESITKP